MKDQPIIEMVEEVLQKQFEIMEQIHLPFSENKARLTRVVKELIKDAHRQGIEDVIEVVGNMKLWTKGTVEGTRQDIINRLQYLK